jgi:ubiquitin fusion degradation protein 1
MFNFFGGQHGGSFEAHYRALPVAFIDKAHAEHGDKVILPPSALDRLGTCRPGGRLAARLPRSPRH